MIDRRRLLAGFGALCAAPAAARAASAVPLRVGSSIDDDATPLFYGIQSGTFGKYGLDVRFERATSGSAVAAGVVGGSFDIGKSSITSLSAAHARGLPLLVVAPAGEYDVALTRIIGIFVRADGPVKTGADLAGKTMGVASLNDFFSLAARAWTDAHGGDSSTLKLLEVPMSQGMAAVEAGRLDATILVQPFYAEAMKNPRVRLIGDPASALGQHYLQTGWFTSNAFARQNADTVDRFIKAMRENSTYVNAHPAETYAILTKAAGVGSGDNRQQRVMQGVRLDVAQIQPLIDAQAKYHMIPAPYAARDIIYPPALL